LVADVLDALALKGTDADSMTETAVREKVTRLIARFPIYNA
jgi:glycine hydroxymethyltransferase